MNDLTKLLHKAVASREALRYLVVVIIGSVIDLSIAWTTHEVFGVHIVASAALGYLIATVLSYFAHEFWTFQSMESSFSTARLGKFAGASAVTLTARLFLVWISAPLSALPFGSLLRLMFALAGSLVVGFTINLLLVFKRDTRR